jgi:hypothetical protein
MCDPTVATYNMAELRNTHINTGLDFSETSETVSPPPPTHHSLVHKKVSRIVILRMSEKAKTCRSSYIINVFVIHEFMYLAGVVT